MKIAILTIGCRLNQSETESMTTTLKGAGHSVVFSPEGADAVIINSCAVTLRSERKTRNLIYRSIRDRAGTTGPIIVTGCAAPKVMTDDSVIFVPNDQKYLVPKIIEASLPAEEVAQAPGNRFAFDPPLLARRNRVNLKIQDGCDNRCSYCYIPLVRGDSASRPWDSVHHEFRQLLDHGYREIILTGVQVGCYNHKGTTLAALTEQLLSIKGDYRIHIASIAPMHIEDRLIDLFSHDRMVKHMNLSLQSGSDKILKAMGRSYTARDYGRIVDRVRSLVPRFNLTTDVIVGFPGESDEDFDATLKAIGHAGFSHIHTFPFSPRPGTAAAAMENPVHESVKKERSRQVRKLFNEKKKAYYRQFHGKKAVLLTEKTGKETTTGHTEYYLPVKLRGNLERNLFYTLELQFNEKEMIFEGDIDAPHP